MRPAAFLLALLVCSGIAPRSAANREGGRIGRIVIYQAPWELHAITEDQRVISIRSSDPEPPLGGNALAAVPEQRLLIIDLDGVNIYRLGRTKRDGSVPHLIATPVSSLPDFSLRGTTSDGRFLIVTAKKDLEDVLLALPVTGRAQEARELPVRCGRSGNLTILPAPAGKTKDRKSLLAFLTVPFVYGHPCDLVVLDISAGSASELARLPNVLDAAWCQASGKLIAVLSPKSARKLNLKSNLVEWDFGKRKVSALGEGFSFKAPIVDGGALVVCGSASTGGFDIHRLAVILRRRAQDSSTGGPTRRILRVRGEPTNLYVTSDGRWLMLLAWRMPSPHATFIPWAHLISYDLKTGRSNELAHEANHYTIIEDCMGTRAPLKDHKDRASQ